MLTVKLSPSIIKGGRYSIVARVLYIVVMALIVWFYFWTIDPHYERNILETTGNGYYNLLTRGFLKGQTSLDRQVEPAILALKNPYDPLQRAGLGMHDASYFKGRYFIYFGVTPVLTLFAPVKILTGNFIDERLGILFFSIAGFLFSVLLLFSLQRTCFCGAPKWLILVSVCALGLTTMVPALLRRPSVWEVPIAAAYAFYMLTLFFSWRAISACKSWLVWLLLASLFMGLTIGARPTYLLGSLVLLAPVFYRIFLLKYLRLKVVFMGAFAPILIVGFMLGAYNYVRFGNVAEFGISYQMAGADIRALKLLSPVYIVYNFKIYILAAAGLTPYFPFITVIDPPIAPSVQFGLEDPYGLLPCMPWIVFILATVFSVFNSRVSYQLRFWLVGSIVSALGVMGLLFCFLGAAGRFMVDFTPVLMLLSSIGVFYITDLMRGFWRVVLSLIIIMLAFWSTAFGVLSNFQHNGLFKIEYPDVYTRLATIANYPSHFVDLWKSQQFGPVQLNVIFPLGATGRIEPLVVTGRTFRSDYLYVHYLADDTVRFGYEHTSYGGKTGEPFKIVPGKIQTLIIDFGPLYPPAEHPYFDGMSLAQARLRHRTIRVTLNGQVALHSNAELYDAVARRPDIGHAGERVAFRAPFSGVIKNWRVLPEAAPVVRADEFGPLVIFAKFPAFTGVRSEPLVSSGEQGKGDLVYIKYLDANTVVFGYDHWGVGGFETEPLKVESMVVQHIGVDYGALYPLASAEKHDRIILRLNGRVVADRVVRFHACSPDTVVVGANLIGASTATPVFSGELLGQDRVRSPASP